MAATNEIRETTPKILHESAVVSRRLEQAYLSAAEKGVVKTLQKLLARRNEFNVNCVGSNRKSAIDLAIENEHLDVLSLLLENGVQDPNGLLRAVDVNFTKAVEMICQHAYKANQFEVIESKDSTGEFHPDITPLILAAHTNNYDIIKILLDYGANIKAPGSDSYVTEKHTLQRSLGTLNIYRAISSESYISLTSEDPIQTAFELGTKLRKMSATDYEFRQEYQELSEKCEQYAADLLGQTRDTKELKTILHHDLSKWKHADRISKGFPYKILASIDHKQKRFVAHPNCQQYLIEKWYEGLGSWRDYSLFKQLFISLLIMIASPIISIAYIIFPKGFIGRFARTPYVKFLMTFASTLVFLGILISSTSDALGSDDEYARTLLFTPQNFVLFLFVMGDTWTEIKELWSQGLSDYREDKWNWLSYFNITLYWTVFGLMFVTYFDKNIFTEQAVVRSRSTREVFCNGNGTVWNGLCAPPPECTNGYQYDSDKGVCCLEDAEKYHDCYYRGCEGGLIFDGLNCIYFDNENSSWLVDTTVDSCNDGFAYDSDIGMCRPLPSCFGGYLLSVEHFSCCLPNQNGTGCEVMPCPFREWFEYSGEDCYWWDGTQLWIWNNYLTLEKFKEFTSNNTLPEIKRLLDEAVEKIITNVTSNNKYVNFEDLLLVQDTVIRNLSEKIKSLGNNELADLIVKSVTENITAMIQILLSDEQITAETPTLSPLLQERSTWSDSDIRLLIEILYAIANITSFMKLLRFVVMNETIGPLEISLEGMTSDVIKFFFIFSFVWFAFSLGLTQLMSKEEELYCNDPSIDADCGPESYYNNLYLSLETLFWSLFGLVELESILSAYHTSNQAIGEVIFAVYLLFAAIVLLNALIAMMSNTYTRIEEDSDTEWKFARANLWMGFLTDGATVPPPFNIIPTPKSVWHLMKCICYFFCRCLKPKKNMKKINEDHIIYVGVLKQLVARYIISRQSSGADEDSGQSKELLSLKRSLVSFRREVLETTGSLDDKLNHQLAIHESLLRDMAHVKSATSTSNDELGKVAEELSDFSTQLSDLSTQVLTAQSLAGIPVEHTDKKGAKKSSTSKHGPKSAKKPKVPATRVLVLPSPNTERKIKKDLKPVQTSFPTEKEEAIASAGSAKGFKIPDITRSVFVEQKEPTHQPYFQHSPEDLNPTEKVKEKVTTKSSLEDSPELPISDSSLGRLPKESAHHHQSFSPESEEDSRLQSTDSGLSDSEPSSEIPKSPKSWFSLPWIESFAKRIRGEDHQASKPEETAVEEVDMPIIKESRHMRSPDDPNENLPTPAVKSRFLLGESHV